MRLLKTWLTLSAYVILTCGTERSGTGAPLFNVLSPTPGAQNSGEIELRISPELSSGAIVQLLSNSTIGIEFDRESNTLIFDRLDLRCASGTFQVGGISVRASGLSLGLSPLAVEAVVSPDSGAFGPIALPVTVTGKVSVDDLPAASFVASAVAEFSGQLRERVSAGGFDLVNATGRVQAFQLTWPLAGHLSVDFRLNFGWGPPLDESLRGLQVGSDIGFTGRGFTPGTVLKLYLATSTGMVDLVPSGLNPTSVTQDGTIWRSRLPWPWPVSANIATSLGNGYVAAQMIRTDRGYSVSNPQGILLFGNPAVDPPVPTILFVDDWGLSPWSSNESIAVANVEGVVAPGATVSIVGEGFLGSVVNIFSAQGNCAPQGGVYADVLSDSALTFEVPASCPIGPGSIQVVNALGDYIASNAVSIPIGEQVSIESVELVGDNIRIHGTGFNELTVINLFGQGPDGVVNAGGLLESGEARLPIELVSAHELRLKRPAGLSSGRAFVEAINPPFIPFTASGVGENGAFSFP